MKTILTITLLTLSVSALTADIYASPAGDDTNLGTKAKLLKSLAAAH